MVDAPQAPPTTPPRSCAPTHRGPSAPTAAATRSRPRPAPALGAAAVNGIPAPMALFTPELSLTTPLQLPDSHPSAMLAAASGQMLAMQAKPAVIGQIPGKATASQAGRGVRQSRATVISPPRTGCAPPVPAGAVAVVSLRLNQASVRVRLCMVRQASRPARQALPAMLQYKPGRIWCVCVCVGVCVSDGLYRLCGAYTAELGPAGTRRRLCSQLRHKVLWYLSTTWVGGV